MPYNIMVGLDIENINVQDKHDYLAPSGTDNTRNEPLL